MKFARVDRSPVALWWWTVDRWSLVALVVLMVLGAMLSLAASPAAASRLGYAPFYFARRQLEVLPASAALMFALSLQTPRTVRHIALAGFGLSLLLLALTLVIGVEVNGARRWIPLPLFSLEPSEFLKPTFAVTCAWLFAEQKQRPQFPGNLYAGLLLLLVVAMLLRQPDFGTAVLVTAVWFAQFFLAGLRFYWVAAGAFAGVSGLIGAYAWMPHVRVRINEFLNPSAADNYQVNQSIAAFIHGGLWGQGPGEGTVKYLLPDAHADFIFAVAGEELGLLACLFIVALFAFVVLRGLSRLLQESNLFILLAATGLLVEFGLQAAINMATTLRLIPAKGMTLPFLSYGGSSLLAMGIGMGMVLALTRRRLAGGPL